MKKFNVKIDGPYLEKYRFLRNKGFGIKGAKKIAKINPSIFNFETFEEFTGCVKYFHKEPFKIETDVDFGHDVSDTNNLAKAFGISSEDAEIENELSDETHLKNIEMVNAIIHWQQSNETDTFFCGNNSNHQPLYAGIDSKTNTVVMACPDCDYVKMDIPDTVLEYYKNYLKNRKNG